MKKQNHEDQRLSPEDLARADAYLWDPGQEQDPQIARLEELLSPRALTPDEQARLAPLEQAQGNGLHWPVRIAALGAAAAVLLLGMQFLLGHDKQMPKLSTKAGQDLPAKSSFVATQDGEELILTQGSSSQDERLATLHLSAGSRLAIRSLDRDETLLALQHGELEAFVSAVAKPGFFNVDTPATRCVDLGCQYRLRVDAQGKAHVRVLSGRVAFRDQRKPWRHEVFVPQGAICSADPLRGSGTPRFTTLAASLEAILDDFDALGSSEEKARRKLAKAFIAQAQSKEDMLPVWHFLQDPDAQVALAAASKLAEGFRKPNGVREADRSRPTAETQALWREALWPDPYR